MPPSKYGSNEIQKSMFLPQMKKALISEIEANAKNSLFNNIKNFLGQASSKNPAVSLCKIYSILTVLYAL